MLTEVLTGHPTRGSGTLPAPSSASRPRPSLGWPVESRARGVVGGPKAGGWQCLRDTAFLDARGVSGSWTNVFLTSIF